MSQPNYNPRTRSSEFGGSGGIYLHRKYEEFAHILDFSITGKASTVKKREGIIIQAIGEERLTLLELLGDPKKNFDIGERVYIGREGREKIISVITGSYFSFSRMKGRGGLKCRITGDLHKTLIPQGFWAR